MRKDTERALPYRGTFGEPRPPSLSGLALPPAAMPPRDGLRPLKAWRYVGVYGPELMVCMAAVRVGPARQAFWAVWDRVNGRLHEGTAMGRGSLQLERGRVRLEEPPVRANLELNETAGVETVSPSGASYAWTRKQGGVAARGEIEIAGSGHRVDCRAVIDDSAGYHARHTSWRWSAGVGVARHGQLVAWNLVSGINDSAAASERTVWIDGVPTEAPPTRFADDLRAVGDLRFNPEAERERRDNLLLVRSSYRQPFGTFTGTLPGGIELREAYGVMEDHKAWW